MTRKEKLLLWWDALNTALGILNPFSTLTAIGAAVWAALAGKWDLLMSDFRGGRIDPFNQDAQIALDAKVLGFYKGSTLVRQKRCATCSIFGTIFMLTDGDTDHETLLHEYGHSVQERILGPLYLLHIALPSGLFYLYDRRNDVGEEKYYACPWERSAEFLGGVCRKRFSYPKRSLSWSVWENLLGLPVAALYLLRTSKRKNANRSR